ncbi:MAG: extradiol dioxygenase family protein [Planctomycetota bacterium]|jgi:extradiol dioxygenase family protein
MNSPRPPFHHAFPVTSIEEARNFYGGLLECSEGRSADTWIDFNFFGHQIALHLRAERSQDLGTTPVDNKQVPLPHFGVVLDMQRWDALADRLRAAQVEFIIEPYTRFEGEVGEQGTMFLRDPSGNALEFKGFTDPEDIFAH